MIPALYDEKQLFYYDGKGEKIQGMNPQMSGNSDKCWGDCTYTEGDVSFIYGDLTGLKIESAGNFSGPLYNLTVGLSAMAHGGVNNLYGDTTRLTDNFTYLAGDFTGVYGSCYGLTGDVDKCELTEKDRENGVNIKDLIVQPGTTPQRGLRSIKEQLEEIAYIEKKIELLQEEIAKKKGRELFIANVMSRKQIDLHRRSIAKIMKDIRSK